MSPKILSTKIFQKSQIRKKFKLFLSLGKRKETNACGKNMESTTYNNNNNNNNKPFRISTRYQ
jgi:hypothetical protein